MTGEIPNSVLPVKSVRQLKISCHNCMQKLDVTSFDPFARIQCPVCGTELIVPAWFDSYLLEEQGGCGGMASVYRALDPALDREVAIKVLKPEISDNPERAELFLHEARAAATINHFAVVPIYTCGVYEGRAYIVMQFMGGGSLDQQLKLAHGKLPILSVVTWIRDIAEGLENAENHGIIHHDVKPGNILLDSEGKAKIGDFGIAQITHSGKSDSVEESIQEIAKTWLSPHYVSPEKVRTGKEGVEGDIYSLGATFYHLLTGVTPFSHENVEELLRMRLVEQPMPPHLQRTDIDMELSQLVMVMMARSPSDRPGYKTIIASLNRIIKANSANTVPLPVKKIRSEADPALIQELRSAPAQSPESGRRSFPLASFLLLIFLLAAGAGGIFYAWRQGFLDQFFPVPENEAETIRSETLDPNPEITSYLSSGDLSSALICADLTFSDPSFPLKKRATALFQAACALHLAAVRDPQSEVQLRLARLKDGSEDPEKPGEIDALLSGIRLLAGAEADPAPKAGAELLVAQSILSAENALSAGGEKLLSEKFSALEKALNALPAGSWLASAWKNHIPAWRQAALSRCGKKEEIEPLFARLIVREAEWEGLPAFQPVSSSSSRFGGNLAAEFASLGADEEDSSRTGEAPDLSSSSLEQAAETYLKRGRPAPDAPALLSPAMLRAHLKELPEEMRAEEERRGRIMCQLRPYLAAAFAGNAYQTDTFTLTDGTELGAGEVLFNEQYPVFRHRRENGEYESRRLSWDHVPAREILTILLYCATYRENAHFSIGKTAGMTAETAADAFLRYAVFAQWYGYYDEAARAAGKVRALLTDPRVDGYLEHLLLR